ncbi:MAG TPA: hypothetical protein VF283_20175 [Bryobacteraceae bacterium]
MANKFRFRSSDHVGAADAESDHAFLAECFVDTGELDLLLDCDDHRRIVLGRTGAGKTALLSQLSERSNQVINIKPESLALAYISNSTILQFIHSLGVNLDTFFKLLWRHVFTVEVIKAHFHLDSGAATAGFFDWVKTRFSDKRRQHEKALAYLEKWGSAFWEQTDYRIEELTTKLENDLKASISTALPIAQIGLSGASTLTQEEKGRVVERAKYVVNQVQIQELSYVLELLDTILDDPQKRYYIVIDRLDENWVEDRLRYLLIRALIETVRDFRRVRHAKIIIALRYDLLDRVLRLARGAGFQEEKYESLYLHLNWTPEQLTRLLDLRINRLVRQSFTTQSVTHKDILPKSINKVPVMEYILDRTFMRPRDVIMFFNICISQARGNPEITPRMLKEAEGEYSRKRLRSLADEWAADYPLVMILFEVLKGRPAHFPLSDVNDEDCIGLAIKLLREHADDEHLCNALADIDRDPTKTENLRRWLAAVLYRTGAIGLKLERFESTEWSTSGQRSISISEISSSARISVHPCFWRSLGINPARSSEMPEPSLAGD